MLKVKTLSARGSEQCVLACTGFFLAGLFPFFSPLCKMVKRGILPTYDWSFCTCFLWLPELFSICFLTSLSTGLNQLADCGTFHDAV